MSHPCFCLGKERRHREQGVWGELGEPDHMQINSLAVLYVGIQLWRRDDGKVKLGYHMFWRWGVGCFTETSTYFGLTRRLVVVVVHLLTSRGDNESKRSSSYRSNSTSDCLYSILLNSNNNIFRVCLWNWCCWIGFSKLHFTLIDKTKHTCTSARSTTVF